MLTASVLPALHAHGHFSSLDSDNKKIKTEHLEKLSESAVTCELCDFNFSLSGEPEIHSYILQIPGNNFKQNISTAETIYLLQQTIFSLRAPPVSIA